jgi:hypothetical protein
MKRKKETALSVRGEVDVAAITRAVTDQLRKEFGKQLQAREDRIDELEGLLKRVMKPKTSAGIFGEIDDDVWDQEADLLGRGGRGRDDE